ncbi:hypothetical protein EDC48_116141 [Gibbsiella quercinecans]|nr:hypothetical protein EDC48_116141 [Gibbsiella quercinecans]
MSMNVKGGHMNNPLFIGILVVLWILDVYLKNPL